MYNEIQEKGFFWAFDQIVETGQIPYEEILARMSKIKIIKPIKLGSEEMGKVLGQDYRLGSVFYFPFNRSKMLCPLLGRADL